MDCRITRLLTLKADGHIVCDDSSGYSLILGEVSKGIGWNIKQVIDGPVYSHVRRSFAEGRVPWPGLCETCHTFSAGAPAIDTLSSRIRLMVEPTLDCSLGCPSCMRKKEARIRAGAWDLDPEVFSSLLRSCAKEGIAIEEIHYLGWGEPLMSGRLGQFTKMVRKWHPFCIQETTTSGSVDLSDSFGDIELDRLTISCDGANQASYVQYRRGGDIEKVFTLMRNLDQLGRRPFTEWKYILFDHNDSEEEVRSAQKMAAELRLDSMLFIITRSKRASKKYTTQTIASFPIEHDFVRISPAAELMKIRSVGTVIAEASSIGDRDMASMFIDEVLVTESDILELRGWAIASDGSYVDRIDCYSGLTKVGSTRPRQPRFDVVAARQNVRGPHCGFEFKIPLQDGRLYNALHFIVEAAGVAVPFSIALAFSETVPIT